MNAEPGSGSLVLGPSEGSEDDLFGGSSNDSDTNGAEDSADSDSAQENAASEEEYRETMRWQSGQLVLTLEHVGDTSLLSLAAGRRSSAAGGGALTPGASYFKLFSQAACKAGCSELLSRCPVPRSSASATAAAARTRTRAAPALTPVGVDSLLLNHARPPAQARPQVRAAPPAPPASLTHLFDGALKRPLRSAPAPAPALPAFPTPRRTAPAATPHRRDLDKTTPPGKRCRLGSSVSSVRLPTEPVLRPPPSVVGAPCFVIEPPQKPLPQPACAEAPEKPQTLGDFFAGVGREEEGEGSPVEGGTSGGRKRSGVVGDSSVLTWGLPEGVGERYVESGVSQLFPWQVECLQTTEVLSGGSLVYCAPTSGGKTLVAEMAIARRFATLKKRKCLFIVPYVALAAEKVASLQHTLEPMKLVVGTQAGGRGNRLMLDDVAVCTIERANAIVNTALDMGRLEEIATVVVDELHNIADPSRGYLLEVLLTKLLYSHHGDLQIIGLSATLTNASLLASWLKDAAFFSTSHRPLPLTESYHVIGSGMRVVYRPDATKECLQIGTPAVHVRPAANGAHDADKDCLLALVQETLRDGGSVLVFCATKQAVEATARRVASHFANAAPDAAGAVGESADARASACRMLACNPCGTDKVLQGCVEQGVAYHHAGLTYEEREVVEAAFKDGCVRVLCCTSTLAAGVNLPARRVILHGTRIGIERIDAIRYKQAAGRAGRLGLDTAGDVVVITTPAEERYVEELITGALPPVTSSLTSEKRGMVRAIGEAVASGIVSSAADVQSYAASSFLHYENLQNGQGASATAGVALLALQFLERHGFITWEANASETKGAFSPTALSKATFKSGLSPEEAKLAAEFLEQARRHFVMCHDLHLVYHCTPFATGIEPKWGLYYEALTRRDSGVREIAAIVGVSNATLSVAQMRLRPPDDPSEATILRRFYAALILYDLVREKPIDEVARRHQLARGNVQRLMESAASFSGMIASLAESLNWYGLSPMIQQLRQRLKDGVENDIVPLMRVPGMKPYKARAFYQNGYRTVACLAAADARKIDEVLAASHPYTRHRPPPPPPKARPNAGAGAQTQNDPDATPGRRLIHDARLLLREDALELKEALQDAEATVASVCTSSPPPPPPPFQTEATSAAAPAGKAQANAPRAVRVGAEYGKPTFNRTYGVVPASATATATTTAPTATASAASTTTATAVAPTTRLPSSKPVPFVAPAAPQPKAETPLPERWPPPLQKEGTATTTAASTAATGVATGGGTRGGGHSLRSLEAARRQGAAAGLQQHSGAGMRRAEAEQRGGFTTILVSYADRGSDVEKRFEAALRAGAQQCGLGVYEGGATAFGLSVAFDPSLVYHYVVVDPSAAADARERTRRAAVARDLILYSDGLAKACYGTKEALRGALRHVPPHDARRMEAIGRAYADPRVAAWMLSPDDKFEGSVSDTIEVLAKRVLQNAESGAAPKRGGALGPHQPSCRAAVLSLLMMRQLKEKLRNTALWEPFATLEMPFAALLASLEHQGLAFDGRVFDDYRKAMEAKAQHLEKQANEMTGYEWSMTCPAQCARALFDSQQLQEVAVRQVRPGVVPPQRRRTETRSTCAAVLRRLSELHPTHPLPRMIGEHRMLVGWATKYLDFIPEFVSASDGRVRAEHHQTATNTGRLAVVDPALQTIPHPVDFYTPGPRSEKVTVELRRAFTAPSQHVLIVADYSQIEVRIMAHFSKDPCLTGFLNEGGDVFRRIASKVHAKPMEAVTPFERKTAKTICYGILYGKGAASLAEDLDCERDDASRFLKDFKKTYEGVTRYITGVVSLCRERGYVETLMGRKRFFPTIYSKNDRERAFAERAAVNTVCQGSAADIVKRAMLALQAALPPSAAMTLQVHDEVLVECPAAAVDAVVGIVRRTMETAASLTVTLPVAIRVGPSWGQLSDA